MKKRLICAALSMLVLSVPMAVSADDTVKIDKEQLTLDDTWVDDYINPSEYHYFPVNIEKAGKLNLKIQTFFSGGTYSHIEFLNGDYETLEEYDSAYIFGTKGQPETVYFEYYLEPGEYYLRINSDSDDTNQG
ncbi:MAG: hypothetical protein Q4B26_07105, partial [Eubacteriales bacterium]|nr:hypothetical protein [Eubacteriales bacterium]